MMKNARPLLLQKLAELALDALLVLLAFIAAYWLKLGQFASTDFPLLPYLQLAALTTPAFVLLLIWGGHYRLAGQRDWVAWRTVSSAALVGTMLFVLIFFFKREFFFSRTIVLLVFVLATLLLFARHKLAQSWQRIRYRRGIGTLPTLIIGNTPTAERIIEHLRAAGSRYQIVAALAPYGGSKTIASIAVSGKLDALERVVAEQAIAAIIQVEATEQTHNITAFCTGHFLECLLSPAMLNTSVPLQVEQIDGVGFVRLQLSPLFGWAQLGKRAFDIAVALPVCLLLTPWLLFRRKQSLLCARDASCTSFVKYQFTSAGKHPFSKFIPEFWHVLRGQMSLIGPRPRPVDECRALKLHERRRLLVKPGVFGEWQLAVLRGTADDPRQALESDITYILRWSFVRDLGILLMTARLFFQREK